MKTDVMVINLDRSPERLVRIDAQLRGLGVAYTRVRGVDGRALPAGLLEAPRGRERFFRALGNGEIGVYQSHRACWQRVLDEGLDWAIVLEDDVDLAPSFVEVPAAVEAMPRAWDMLKLSVGWRRRRVSPIGTAGAFAVVAFDKVPTGAQGYVVSRRGAERLLRGNRRPMRPVDVDMQFWWETRTEVFGLSPFPVSVDPVGTGEDAGKSEVWRYERRQRRPVARIVFSLCFWVANRRSWWRLRRLRREWRDAVR